MVLGSLAFLAVLASGAVRIGPDTYWHIVTGQWIWAHGHVPRHDPFSFTMHGAPWFAQEWGAELLMASVYGLAGWSGLIMLAALAFGLSIAYLARFMLSRMEPLHAVSLTILSGCMMLSYILVRPEEFVWPLTALWVGGLIAANESHRAPHWWLLGVILLWANMHASVVLGLGLAGLIAAEAVINANDSRKIAARDWGAFVAAAIGCTLINPRGWRLLIFPFHLLGMRALQLLTEWQQPHFDFLQVFSLWLALILALAFSGRIRLPLLRLLPLVGLIYFGMEYVRNVSLLGLVSPLLMASPIAHSWKRESRPACNNDTADRVFQALIGPGSRIALVAIILFSGAVGIALVSVGKSGPPAQYAPRRALDALLDGRRNVRILNDYNFGGYLIFRHVPVFVDGRADMYGSKFIMSYFEALELIQRGKLNPLLKKYRINAILMGRQWPLARLLGHLPEWKRVYAGKWAVAYVHRGVQASKT